MSSAHETADGTTEQSVPHGGGEPHAVTIVVNGRDREVTAKEVSYDDVVRLAFAQVPTGENVLITITYRRGHGDKPEGNLLPGGTVKVKGGMVFVVTATDKS